MVAFDRRLLWSCRLRRRVGLSGGREPRHDDHDDGPSGSQGASNATNYADGVAYAACMRTHGVPNMPDPNSQGNFSPLRGFSTA